MLKSLSIKNIVLIEKLELNFNNGLTVFSGETGAGKSIILTSLGLAVGARADFSLIRNKAKEGTVTAEFKVDKSNLAFKKTREYGLNTEETIILRRVLFSEGGSKAFINDNLVSLNFLKEIGSMLVEIHGQNEKIGLLDPVNHLKILDRFGGNNMILSQVKKSFNNYQKLNDIYKELLNIESSKKNHVEVLENNINLIKNLNLEKGEYTSILKKRNLMTKHEKIFLAINNIHNLLDDEGLGALSNLTRENVNLDKSFEENEKLDEIKEVQKAINNILIEGKDILLNISKLKEDFLYNKNDLDNLEQRLFDISTLSRRFKIQPEALEEKLKELNEEYTSLNQSSENLEKIKSKLSLAKIKYEEDCHILTKSREKALKELQEQINLELRPLKLENAKFMVELSRREFSKWNKEGADIVKFLISFNKGISKGEIHKVSSGGELSRLMLAINLVIAKTINKKTLIFDEVDTGVSGAVADSIAVRLLNLSEFQQVLVVTHLPQVAAKGNYHYKTYKKMLDENTFTSVLKLDENDRIEEIAKMISGDTVTNEARNLSSKLLRN